MWHAWTYAWLSKQNPNIIWKEQTIFSTSPLMYSRFQLIYLINESIRKRVAEDDYFWGSFIALPLLTACAVWFVERLKWGWLVEQRPALDLHTLLNHTDSRLPTPSTSPPQMHIYLRARAPPDSQPYGTDNIQPRVPDTDCCWQCGRLRGTSGGKRFALNPRLLKRILLQTSKTKCVTENQRS